MQNTLIFPSIDSSNADSRNEFNVIIAYEDLEMGKYAKRVYDYLAENLDQELTFNNHMWKFEVLSIPKLREMAAKDAMAADIIIVSAHGSSELSPEVGIWIDLWLQAGTRAIALVGLSDAHETPAAHSLREYLADVARRGDMEFFSQPDWKSGTPNELRHPVNNPAISALENVIHQNSGNLHWGINE